MGLPVWFRIAVILLALSLTLASARRGGGSRRLSKLTAVPRRKTRGRRPPRRGNRGGRRRKPLRRRRPSRRRKPRAPRPPPGPPPPHGHPHPPPHGHPHEDSLPHCKSQKFSSNNKPRVEADCLWEDCACDKKSPYSRVDGVCNNLQHPYQGAAGAPFERLMGPNYEASKRGARNSDIKSRLPSPREVSKALIRGFKEKHDGEGSSPLRENTNRTMFAAMFFAWTLFDGGALLEEKRERDCCELGSLSNSQCGSYDVLDIADDYPLEECSLNSFEEANICCPEGTFGVGCAVSCESGHVCVPERGGLGRCRPSCSDGSDCSRGPADCYRDTDKGADICFCPFGTVQDKEVTEELSCLTKCSETVPCPCEDDNAECDLMCVPVSLPTDINAQASLQGVCREMAVPADQDDPAFCKGRNNLLVLVDDVKSCACPLGHYKLNIDSAPSGFDCYKPCTTREDCPEIPEISYQCNYAKRFNAKVCVPQQKCESNDECPGNKAEYEYEYCQRVQDICHPPCSNDFYKHCKMRGALCYVTEHLKDQCYCAYKAKDDGTCLCRENENDCPPDDDSFTYDCSQAGICVASAIE